jgi:hypothetical protein
LGSHIASHDPSQPILMLAQIYTDAEGDSDQCQMWLVIVCDWRIIHQLFTCFD